MIQVFAKLPCSHAHTALISNGTTKRFSDTLIGFVERPKVHEATDDSRCGLVSCMFLLGIHDGVMA